MPIATTTKIIDNTIPTCRLLVFVPTMDFSLKRKQTKANFGNKYQQYEYLLTKLITNKYVDFFRPNDKTNNVLIRIGIFKSETMLKGFLNANNMKLDLTSPRLWTVDRVRANTSRK